MVMEKTRHLRLDSCSICSISCIVQCYQHRDNIMMLAILLEKSGLVIFSDIFILTTFFNIFLVVADVFDFGPLVMQDLLLNYLQLFIVALISLKPFVCEGTTLATPLMVFPLPCLQKMSFLNTLWMILNIF
jgi:hypothetical protein